MISSRSSIVKPSRVGLLLEGVVDARLPVDQGAVDVEGDEVDLGRERHAARIVPFDRRSTRARSTACRVRRRSWTCSSTRASSSSPATASRCPTGSPARTRRRGRRRRRRDRLPVRRQGAGARSAAAARPAASRSPRTSDEAREHADGDPRHGHPRPHRPRGLDRGRLARSRPSTTRRSSSTARAKKPLSCSRRKGGMDIEAVAEEDPERDRHAARRPAARLPGLPRPPAGLRGRRRRRPRAPDRRVPAPSSTTTFVAEEAMLVEVNPLIVTPDRAGRARSTPRSRSTTTRSSATPTTPSCATRRAEDPQEQMAKERGLTYVKLDGDIGILGNGAGLVMSTLDVVAQAGGAAGELPRRGRRLEGRGDHERGRGDPLRPEGQGRALQHLRRHHALRRGRQRARRGVRPDQARRCRSSCGSTARTTRRAGGSSPRPTCPTCTRRRR